MGSLAENWFRTFFETYQDYMLKNRVEMVSGGKRKRGHWTKWMFGFLASLRKKMGYQKEEGLSQIDLIWRKTDEPRIGIAIEHENSQKGIFSHEIPNLLATNADLLVLITYLPYNEFPGTEYAERLLKELENRKFNEFLLIFGVKRSLDWVGYAFFKAPRYKTLALPYQEIMDEFWKSSVELSKLRT